MIRFPAFFACGFPQGGKGAGNKADEQPDELGCEVGKGVINDRREGYHADDPADANGDEEEYVLDEVLLEIGQELDKGFVDAEDHHQHATRKAWDDGTDAYQHAFDQAEYPVEQTIGLFGRSFRN
ncbi:hypothetical protein SDC9_171655 [bioreactor metagenome]|uniref:Uncharacterized protein n=1 Tax=bioreactor metagenome TaxID=1076179 RepID=A0A645GDV2_9ZZZZ